jgi:hypothetical protein
MAAASSLPSLASLSEALPDAEEWTAEEVAAIKETKRLLLEGGMDASKISPMELSLCVMNCKLRPAKAVQKYKDWIASLEVFGIHSMDDVWSGQGSKAFMQTEWSSTLVDEFSSYCSLLLEMCSSYITSHVTPAATQAPAATVKADRSCGYAGAASVNLKTSANTSSPGKCLLTPSSHMTLPPVQRSAHANTKFNTPNPSPLNRLPVSNDTVSGTSSPCILASRRCGRASHLSSTPLATA